jgi:hypothetical protein
MQTHFYNGEKALMATLAFIPITGNMAGVHYQM